MGMPLRIARHALADLLSGTGDGIAFNKHFDGDGEIIFRHACALGCEGIVSKRLGSAYRSGRVDHWLKIKNPAHPSSPLALADGRSCSWCHRRSSSRLWGKSSACLTRHKMRTV